MDRDPAWALGDPGTSIKKKADDLTVEIDGVDVCDPTPARSATPRPTTSPAARRHRLQWMVSLAPG
jgi:hypothetical protein